MINNVLEFYDNISSSAEITKIYYLRLTDLKSKLHNEYEFFETQVEGSDNKSMVDDGFNKYLDLLFGSGL